MPRLYLQIKPREAPVSASVPQSAACAATPSSRSARSFPRRHRARPRAVRDRAGGRARTDRAAAIRRSSAPRSRSGRSTAPCPRAFAAASARCTSALPMPSLRKAGSTASGPSTSAGTPPALTCHNRTVPTSRPRLSAESARPPAGACPSRRRWQVRSWRLSPKLASSSASRATTSEARSLRTTNGAVLEVVATGFRKIAMARQSSLPPATAGTASSANSQVRGRSRRTGSRLSGPQGGRPQMW